MSQPETNSFDRVDSLVLAYVRVILGITIYFWADGFLVGDKYEALFLEPLMRFKYAGFQWVKLWAENGIYWHFIIAKIAAVCLAIGWLTRASAALLCGSIAYVLLVDRQIYADYYYLLACMAGLLVFLPSGGRLAVDSLIGFERREPTFWRWQLWLLRFQLAVPYVFAALAKFNGDWLRGRPAELILRRRTDFGGNPLLELPGAVEMMSYGGLLYGLLVVPMLLYRPTRMIAVALSVVFHLFSAMTESIGAYPGFMLAMLVVFFPTDSIANRLRLILGQPPLRNCSETTSAIHSPSGESSLSEERGKPSPVLIAGSVELAVETSDPPASGRVNNSGPALRDAAIEVQDRPPTRIARAGFKLALAYATIQILLPMRAWLYPGDANWNQRGHRFAWRMTVRETQSLTHYLLVDKNAADYIVVPSTIILTPWQAASADHDPELIRQTAAGLEELVRTRFDVADCYVYALALTSLNGRRPKPLVDPAVDLTEVSRGWWSDDWVAEDPGPVLDPAWPHESEQWWRQLNLPEPFKRLQGKTPSELQAYLAGMRAKLEASQ